MEPSRDWVDYATLTVTALAAVGTLAAVVIALRQVLRQERRSVKVRASEAVVGTDPTAHVFAVDITNTGFRPVKIKSVLFEMEYDIHIFAVPLWHLMSERLPHVLSDGESMDVMFDIGKLRAAEREQDSKLSVVSVRDAESNEYKIPFPGTAHPAGGRKHARGQNQPSKWAEKKRGRGRGTGIRAQRIV